MSAILPFVKIDSDALLCRYFTHYQICWIEAEAPFHAAKKQVFALAEKSVRIGWTFCDGFKNVRKRLRFKKRDYLFVTKDWPSALEYMNHVYDFADILGYTRAVLSHGEDVVKVKSLDPEGRPTSLTEEVKIGYIKFQNGSRIIAFSSNPYAMAVYGGDVGLDEFAKHPNAKLLWQTAQARVTWACDLAVWSSHDGEDTLFNQFAQQARAACSPLVLTATGSADFQSAVSQVSNLQPAPSPAPVGSFPSATNPSIHQSTNPSSPPSINSQPPTINCPWNLYFRVTMPDAVELGLLDVINRTKNTNFTAEQFLADCQARSGSEETYQQSYMYNPLGAATASIVEWSAIERCRADYRIERVHLEADQVRKKFGEFNPSSAPDRESQIHQFLIKSFPALLAAQKRSAGGFSLSPSHGESAGERGQSINSQPSTINYRLGFDVAASGQGDLAAIYIDEAKADELWLRALFTCRTEDWHFLKTVLFYFLKHLPNLQAAGDESGLGRQICWEAAKQYSSRFLKVNFAAKKHDLGFALMNQLSVAEKRFPKSEPDIAADYFALRKTHTGTRWAFSEGPNTLNAASHCDIACAGALATHAHTERRPEVWAAVLHENGWFDGKDFHPYHAPEATMTREQAMLLSDDPSIWKTVYRY